MIKLNGIRCEEEDLGWVCCNKKFLISESSLVINGYDVVRVVVEFK